MPLVPASEWAPPTQLALARVSALKSLGLWELVSPLLLWLDGEWDSRLVGPSWDSRRGGWRFLLLRLCRRGCGARGPRGHGHDQDSDDRCGARETEQVPVYVRASHWVPPSRTD